MLFNVVLINVWGNNPQEIRQYNKLKDNDTNWEGMHYPCSNSDIDNLESMNKGLISIKIYHEFEYDGQSGIAAHRRTKTINANIIYHC